jgi:nucleotide-binding universal stress UspA family protein
MEIGAAETQHLGRRTRRAPRQASWSESTRSDSAPAVAAVGDRLASSLGLQLMLVHATTGTAPCGELLERADPRRGIGTRRSVVIGGPTDALPRAAREDDAALLVIGTGTYKPIRELFHRSKANAIARAASQPVVLVSPAAAERERSPRPPAPSAIVCAIDQSPEARRVAEVGGALAAATLTRLVLVHASSANTQGPIEDLLLRQHCDITMRGVDSRPSEWLEAIGGEENAALAVINADEPKARSVASWATRPVLVVPPTAASEATDTLTRLRSTADEAG